MDKTITGIDDPLFFKGLFAALIARQPDKTITITQEELDNIAYVQLLRKDDNKSVSYRLQFPEKKN